MTLRSAFSSSFVALGTAVLITSVAKADTSHAPQSSAKHHGKQVPAQRERARESNVQLGPRPYYLVNDLPPSPLKNRLEQCSEGPFRKSDFSIGHRGAALQFPEHTKES